ncbi:MAG TPA: spherulation-specific family 4 protein [Candidatus Binatia bacterium]|jgi:hypothetical protein
MVLRMALRAAVLAACCMPASGAKLAAASPLQSIAIPAYFYPSYPDPLWTQMEHAVPTVSFAVMNPANGAGPMPDSNYTSQIAHTRAAGIKVLGYVYSSYATRDPALLKTDIDNYYAWYGVDGIFIDEADDTCANEPYYADLDTYVKAKGGLGLTVINPGNPTLECYAAAADIILDFEGSWAQYQTWMPTGWESGYDSSRFWHLIYATSEADVPQAVLLSQQRNAGFVYVTTDQLPNPWDTLPSPTYWSTELSYVQPTSGGCSPPVAKPKLQIRGIDTPDADDSLKFSGTFVLAGTPSIDPVTNGLRFVIADGSGTTVDVTIAAGAYSGDPGSGWTGSSGKWKYQDRTAIAASGITKAQLKSKSDGVSTTVSFRIFGSAGSYPVNPAQLPLSGAVLLEPTTPTTNCATATFAADGCLPTGTTTGVRCK